MIKHIRAIFILYIPLMGTGEIRNHGSILKISERLLPETNNAVHANVIKNRRFMLTS